ncbi:MAG: ribulokinase [Planctomycetota bacterium]
MDGSARLPAFLGCGLRVSAVSGGSRLRTPALAELDLRIRTRLPAAMRCSLGLDFGTASVRALVVDVSTGETLGLGEWAFEHGCDGVLVREDEPDLARQHPADYLEGAVRSTRGALEAAGVDGSSVVGIGVDGTGSTPIPVDGSGEALAIAGSEEPAAMAWLWKDHTAKQEAEDLVEAVRRAGLPFLGHTGGTYSSEWYWAKLLCCARRHPDVASRAAAWVELSDFIPAWLTGRREPSRILRGVCAAGHKGMFSSRHGGWPPVSFLAGLHERLGAWARTLGGRVVRAGERVGGLAPGPAALLGLREGIAISAGALDAHVGAIGSGIREGDVVKVIGTSSCDMAVARGIPLSGTLRGIAGIVPDSILPGCIGFEAGQAAVGDLFAWGARLLGRSHEELTELARGAPSGSGGVVCLDWHNGNRCVLMDPHLRGVLAGLSLGTGPGPFYRSLLEGSAFGARRILDRMRELGVPVRRLLACGGIAQKNDLLMQILADVLASEILVAESDQACALGAAMMGAVAAGAFSDFERARETLVRPPRRRFLPDPVRARAMERFYAVYCDLYDAFGTGRPIDARAALRALSGASASAP